ncbi:MAG: DUF1573 domain-containing protein [Bacteroidia bacterium]
MKIKTIITALLLTVSVGAFAQEKKTLDNIGNENPNQASFKFDVEEYNFGTIKQGESVTYEFKFTNTGTEPLIISNAAGSCGCTVPIWPKEPILKGQTSTIKVTFNSTGKMGIQDKTVTLTSNAKQNPMVIHMKGNVDKPADPTTGTPATPEKH